MVELDRRYPCLAKAELEALAELEKCSVRFLASGVAETDCPPQILCRAALIKSVDGQGLSRDLRRSLKRSRVTLDWLTSRVLVNLARVVEGSRALEPFAGSGAVAYEAAMLGAYVVGLDIDYELLRLYTDNVPILGDSVNADSRIPPLRHHFDSAVGDAPYGRMSRSEATPHRVFQSVLDALFGLVKKGGYIALALPNYFEAHGAEEVCAMDVHGGLRRIIAVWRV